MKIAFLSPADYRINYKRQIGPTLGIAYMSSLIKDKLGLTDLSIDVDLNSLLKKKPDLVAIPVYTEDYNRAIYYAKEIKKKLNIPIIAGGPHFTALPETLHEYIDVGVIGEGEEIMLDLASLHLRNALTPENLQKVSGIVYHSQGEKIFTPKRILGELDDLPKPDRDIMKTFWSDLGQTIHWEQGIYTSRGCPFKCIFCQYSKIKKNVRYHSVDRIIGDIEDILRDFPQQSNIIIFDDLFVLSKKRLAEIVKAIKQENIQKKVSFGCMARASVFDEEICQLLKEMNINVISFGFETGSESVLKYLKVDATSIKQNQKAIDLCSKYGINVGGYFIIGAPVETKEDLAQTYWFIRKNIKDMPIAGTFCISPIPGTVVWDYAYERGLIQKNAEAWERINYMDLKKDQYIMLNENYSYEEMMFAYRQLQQMVDKPEKFGGIYQAQMLLKNYREKVTKEVENYLNGFSGEIMEIGEHTRSLYKDLRELTFLSYQEINEKKHFSFETRKFDFIFINHVLEKLEKPFQTLKKLAGYLTPQGKILILFYNSATDSFLNKLINGWDDDWHKIREFEQLSIITIKNLNENLKKLNLKCTILNRYGNNSEASDNLNLVAKSLNIADFLKEKDIFSYLVSLEKI